MTSFALLALLAWMLPYPGVRSVGGAAMAQICPAGSQVREVGQAYRYRKIGRDFLWTIYRKPDQVRVGFRHERADGSWSEQGSINRWPKCPAAKTSVQVISPQGQSRVCTRVCLSDGREELHCPLGQLVLTRMSPLRVCIDTAAAEAEPSPTPEPRPRPCRFRIGCQDYNTCVSCCAENGDDIVGCGLACWFSGGDLGTGRCEEDPFPPDGRDDAISCVPIQGYPNWCDREMPAF
jgi:hypothetical protein